MAGKGLILIVDDNDINRKILGRQVAKFGYAFLMAQDGAAALELLEEKQVQLILTDCHMPLVDGFDLTRRIREGGSSVPADIPIVAVTSADSDLILEKCYRAGMDDVIFKPVFLDNLEEVLKNLCTHGQTAGAESGDGTGATGHDDCRPDMGPLDPEAIIGIFGRLPEDYKEILREFISPAHEMSQQMEAALEGKDRKNLAAASHKMKSAALAIGAMDLGMTCGQIESAANENDWDTAYVHLFSCRRNLSKVLGFLEAL